MVMIELHYGELCIDDALHASLEALLNRYIISDNAERLVLNCRQMSYYRHRQGLHPIEVQLKRESASSPWLVVFFASFSYPDDSSTTVEPELYFHLANRWCYQPDAGSTDLSHPEVQELLSVWMKAFARHLSRNVFDNVQLTMVGTFH
ncbi:DUF2787 domain-containing protein [Vibrio parahaemolyticus]|nr:DUF2787 domain-containing protein [Vibrio parahaemolyticus]EGR3039555.1 DUF2787 domain-containing protein [Vibrio parahaemolyticus]